MFNDSCYLDPGANIYERRSYSYILVTEQALVDRQRLYIEECLYSRHSKGVYYVCDTEKRIRALYEFCFIRFKTMNPNRTTVCMSDIKAEVSRSTELQQNPRCTPRYHMVNLQKDGKDIYFIMLGYDITMYSKHCDKLAQARIVPISPIMQTRTGPATYGESKRLIPVYSKCRNIRTFYCLCLWKQRSRECRLQTTGG